MVLKQVNFTINLLSKTVRFLVIVLFAFYVAKVFLWIISPRIPDLYVESSDIKSFENSVKFVTNRAPFGVVVAPPKPPVPPMASKIKLTGVYARGDGGGIAFYELDGKAYIAKVGDNIGTAVLKSVSVGGIVLSENHVDADVELSFGSSQSNNVQTMSSSPQNNFFNGMQQNQPQQPSRDGGNANNGGATNYQSDNSSNQQGDSVEKRRRMIEEFMQRRTHSGESSH